MTITKADIVKWSWDFGSGTENDPHGRTIEGMNTAHVFETPGTYTVRLTVLDNQGNTSNDTAVITVLAPNGTEYYVDSQIGNDSCCTMHTSDRAPQEAKVLLFLKYVSSEYSLLCSNELIIARLFERKAHNEDTTFYCHLHIVYLHWLREKRRNNPEHSRSFQR